MLSFVICNNAAVRCSCYPAHWKNPNAHLICSTALKGAGRELDVRTSPVTLNTPGNSHSVFCAMRSVDLSWIWPVDRRSRTLDKKPAAEGWIGICSPCWRRLLSHRSCAGWDNAHWHVQRRALSAARLKTAHEFFRTLLCLFAALVTVFQRSNMLSITRTHTHT